MKYKHVYALFLMFVFCTSCGGQNKTGLPKEKIKPEGVSLVDEKEINCGSINLKNLILKK